MEIQARRSGLVQLEAEDCVLVAGNDSFQPSKFPALCRQWAVSAGHVTGAVRVTAANVGGAW
jgi:hypothetical protein